MNPESAAAIVIKKYWGPRRTAVKLLEVFLRPLVWFLNSPPEQSLDQVKRILVFEPGSLGDLVMLIPLFQSLRARFPVAKISLLCRKGGSKKGQEYGAINPSSVETLMVSQGYVDELIPVRVPWLLDVSNGGRYNPFTLNWPKFALQLRHLKARQFDLAFAGGRSDIRANLVMWLTGAKRRVGYGYAGGAFLLTDVVIPDMDRPHQSELSLQLLEHLEIPVIRGRRLVTVLPQEEAISAKFLKENAIKPDDFVLGVHPGSRVPTRQWGEDRFLQVAKNLVNRHGAKVIWFTEANNGTSRVPGHDNIIPASLPLREFLAVLSRCEFLVCNESGPMHLAAAVGIPAVAVFGSGFPEWFRPLGDIHRIIIRRDMWCRPCADNCIFDQPYCLRLISVEQVMREVEDAVRSIPRAYMGAEAQS